ncbi:hypothetical protein GQX73_g7415 [Xylaria multiplex]|uniref:AB hydrolase-1 domain-containing protein n=1 Tax=Xylaria multiplex TaxID=323545 RepID=A0A7C8IKT2_9PEZI|nr:hypothetical protein GQX73_g7415 [Xylaria multiplex]
MALPTSEGEVAFEASGTNKPCKTWYKFIGSLDSKATPLIALPGGPGGGHKYLTPLNDLYEKYDIPIVYYDQVGCGRSTHFRERVGDDSFWTFDLFIQELDNLIDCLNLRENGFYIFDQSWRGMLGSTYASRRPQGLKKLVLVSSLASMPLYIKGCEELLAKLLLDIRDILEECDRKGTHESEGLQTYRIHPMPEAVQAFNHFKGDPTSYLTMQGPSESVVVGTAPAFLPQETDREPRSSGDLVRLGASTTSQFPPALPSLRSSVESRYTHPQPRGAGFGYSVPESVLRIDQGSSTFDSKIQLQDSAEVDQGNKIGYITPSQFSQFSQTGSIFNGEITANKESKVQQGNIIWQK